jgi:hypothetical protein
LPAPGFGNKNTAIALMQAGTVADRNAAALNVNEGFTLDVVRGDHRFGRVGSVPTR